MSLWISSSERWIFSYTTTRASGVFVAYRYRYRYCYFFSFQGLSDIKTSYALPHGNMLNSSNQTSIYPTYSDNNL
jgi:hypothetical protein